MRSDQSIQDRIITLIEEESDGDKKITGSAKDRLGLLLLADLSHQMKALTKSIEDLANASLARDNKIGELEEYRDTYRPLTWYFHNRTRHLASAAAGALVVLLTLLSIWETVTPTVQKAILGLLGA